MKLRLSDAIRISWSSVGGHKVRSLLTIATIAILFGVMLGVNFVLQGLEDTVVAASVIPTDGKVYAEAHYFVGSGSETMTEEELLDPDYVRRAAELEADASEYGGKRIGTITSFQDNWPLEIVSLGVVKKYVTSDLANVPEGKIPVLEPWEGFQFSEELHGKDAEGLQQFLEDNFYVVGVVPSTKMEWITLEEGNPLNFLLSSVSPNYAYLPLLIDDGSGAVQEYLEGIVDVRLQGLEEEYAEAIANDPEMTEEDRDFVYEHIMSRAIRASRAIVFQFDDPQKAIAYGLQSDDGDIGLYRHGLFSNTISVAWNFSMWKKMLATLEIGLLVVAVVIATLTFGHMIDQDAATIALYRAMGATKLQIMLVYLCYLVELCILALGVCLVIALGIAGVAALLNAGELSRKLQEFYRLAEAPQVWFFALNWVTWTVVGAVFAIAPITLLLADRHFSVRNIARKLKED